MKQIKLKAMAKINIGLDVIGKREDGYHDVRMIMQSIRLFDRLMIRSDTCPGVRIDTNLSYLPVNENNLVYKAAKLLMDEFAVQQGVYIRLDKYIPVAAGLAGGSSDAAATLIGINKIFGLGLSKKQLMDRGIKLGADIPYCILRGTALAEGIGEKLTRLPDFPNCHIVISKPGISVSTKFVYTSLDSKKIERHPDIDGMIREIKSKNLSGITALMENVLERVTVSNYPVIEELKNILKRNGALHAMMSGSGPTVFGIFNDYEKAKNAFAILKSNDLSRQTFLTEVFHNRGMHDER